MYVVLRRWTNWEPAAAIGGALYGFFPYLVGQDIGHVDVAFVPLPPLIALCAYELFVRRTGSPRRWGAALGGLFAAQFFISQEIAATTGIVVVIALFVLAIANPRQFLPAARFAAPGAVIALVVASSLLAYPLWAAVAGPYHYSGPVFPGGLSADVLGAILPTSKELFAPAGWIAHGDRLVAGNVAENGSYLGIPLLALLAYLVARYRRDRWIRFGAVLLVLTWVLTLGARLVLDATTTSMPLPWALVAKAPLLDNLLSVRLTLYVALFAALLLSLGLDHAWQSHATGRARTGARQPDRSRRAVRFEAVLVIVLTAATLLSLVPRWPDIGTGPSQVPRYFSTPAVDRIPLGSVVLISPYPSVAEPSPDLWLAVAGSRFKMIGGYGQFVGSTGGASDFPAVLQPSDIESYLWAEVTGGAGYPSTAIPADGPTLARQMRAFLARYHVGTVLYTTVGTFPAQVAALLTKTLGSPSATTGGVTAWYGVQQMLRRGDPGSGNASAKHRSPLRSAAPR